MKIRENFGKYWIAGLIFSIVSSLTSSLFRLFDDYMASLPGQDWWFGPIFFRIPEQAWWIIVTIIVAIVSILVVPWLYGRLIEALHTKIILRKNPE